MMLALHNRCSKGILLLLLCIITHYSNAQQIAFPGAEGAGRFATGGRGTAGAPTTVFEVTNLSDVNTPGSLRYALSQTATHRTVVFRVSGTIHLTSRLTIRGNTTIAGQTAPGDGICIADYPVVISGDNVIVRYIRIRMGDRNQLITTPANCGVPVPPFSPACMPTTNSGGDDAFGNLGGKNIIVDHCSIGWSSDEALTIYRGDSVTLQWNIVAEPLNYSYHFEGDADYQQHGYGGIWGSKRGSFHHNLIAHAKGRNPRFAGISTYSPAVVGVENADFRNNVVYNWGSYSTNGGDGGNYNLVNNYYKFGPSTGTGNSVSIPVRGMIVQPGKTTGTTPVPYGKFYLSGNYVDGYSNISNNNWLGVSMSGGVQADTTLAKSTTAHDISAVTTHTALEAYALVLQHAGASLNRDTLDERIANDVQNRTGKIIDVQGGYPHGTPYANTVNAWPTLNSTTAPVDTDHDGMSDAWETTNGLDPNDPSDRGSVAANGYTNLENYLNSIITTPAINNSATFTQFAQTIGTPSAIQTCTLRGNNLTGAITVTTPVEYEVSLNGTTWTNSITISPVSGMIASTVISVRLNASSIGNYNGNITFAGGGATTKTLAVNGSSSQNIPTGVRDDIIPAGFSVYPNPAAERVFIKHPRTVKGASVSIYTLLGVNTAEWKVAANTTLTSIDVHLLPQGQYFIHYMLENRKVVLKCMVIK